MIGALHSELFRLVRRRMPWVLLGTLGAVIALLYLLLWLSLEGAQDVVTAEGGAEEIREMLTLREVAGGSGIGLVYVVAGIMTVIMSASIVATEYAWGTIRTILPRTRGRGAFLAAKLAVIAGFALVVSVTGMLSALAASGAVTALAGLDAGLGADFVLRMLGSVALTFVALLPYASLAFLVAVLSRSTAGGVAVGLAMFFVEGQFVLLLSAAGGFVEATTNALLTPNVSAVISLGGPDAEPARTVGRGFAVVGAYTLVPAALALWRFRRRDVLLN